MEDVFIYTDIEEKLYLFSPDITLIFACTLTTLLVLTYIA